MPERILIARNGRLGDMVLVAPAIREVMQRHPYAKFTLLTSNDGFNLFNSAESGFEAFWLHGRTPLSKRLKLLYYWMKLKFSEFDRIYCLDTDWKIQKILKRGASHVVLRDPAEDTGVVHDALKSLHAVGVNMTKLADIKKPFFPVSQKSNIEMDRLLKSHNINKTDIKVGLNPTFSGLGRRKVQKYKMWPFDSWAALIDGLYRYGEETGQVLKPIIYLMPEQSWVGEAIAEKCKHEPVLLVPNKSLELFKSYLISLDLYIGVDTGATHLAAGLGVNMIALFCGTWLYGCGPIVSETSNSIIRAEDIYGDGSFLDSIQPELVFEKAKQKLENRLIS